MSEYLRLRQICLVAASLEPVADDICAVFGVEVCHRDPNVNRYGLHNALMPFGPTFIEVVAPLPGKGPAETAAGRYLQRLGGDGGYMVIMDCEDALRWRAWFESLGVRITNKLEYPRYTGNQLHPKDVGGTLMSMGHDINGDDLWGNWNAAGDHWKEHVRRERVECIAAGRTQTDDPLRLATRWGQVLRRPVQQDGSGIHVDLDNAPLHFVAPRNGRGETMQGLDIRANDVPAILAAARARNLPTGPDTLVLCGIEWRLV